MSSSDNRFAKVYSDPRFMVAPKKVTKVQIDKRFQGMFKEKQFNVVAKVDKYGRRIAKTDNYALQNYYKKEDGSDSDSEKESEQDGALSSSDQNQRAQENPETKKKAKKVANDEDSDESAGQKYYDSDGKFHWSG